MGFRFRKSVKLMPGVRVNLGLSGASLSLGPRGASVSISKRGAYANLGMPGTGISYREKISGGSHKKNLTSNSSPIEPVKFTATVSLQDDGQIEILTNDGQALNRQQKKIFWDTQEEGIIEWLSSNIEEINAESEILPNVHLDTPSPLSPFRYTEKPFKKEQPSFPDAFLENTKPAQEKLNPLGFFTRLFFKSKVKEQELKQKKLDEDFQNKLQQWRKERDDALLEHERQMNAWKTEEKQFSLRQKERSRNFSTLICESESFMEEMLEEYFDTIDWPKETLISYEINDSGKTVLVDVDFPEIEDFPHREARFSANKRRLLIKDKSMKNKNLIYAKHIHGVVFRIIGGVFNVLPKCQEVIASGYSQRLNPSTGHTEDQYLISTRVFRCDFEKVNFSSIESLDPVEFIASLEHARNMTKTGIFKPITPLEKG